jgi:hypothetical protein
VQDYFRADEERRPRQGAKTVRVHVPGRPKVNRRAIAALRRLKQAAVESPGEAS